VGTLFSDQEITLAETGQRARIKGITPDHGLLRTLPVSAAGGRSQAAFVDLQPDGNSFDMLKGLIRRKD
jgi:biotin--protein ligase